MPNRVLRDTTDSDKVNSISAHAERFFYRLFMKADDYGCFFADARILKAHLFPLQLDAIREADIARWTAECVTSGLIVLYESQGKKYLEIVAFGQTLRQKRRKYPAREGCEQLASNMQADCEPETKRNQKPETNLETRKETEDTPSALSLPFNSEKFLSTWEKLKRQPKWTKKNHDALQTSLDKLGEYSENDAIEMMRNAIGGNWQGIFPLDKSKKNGQAARQFPDHWDGDLAKKLSGPEISQYYGHLKGIGLTAVKSRTGDVIDYKRAAS